MLWCGCEAASALSWGRVTIAQVDSLTSKNRRRPGQHLSAAESTRAKATFLKAFASMPNVSTACKRAKISRETAYEWREQDLDFAADWDAAAEASCDALEDVARQRAIETSDTLLIFLLKAHRPLLYRERVEQQHSGEVKQTLTIRIVDDWRASDVAIESSEVDRDAY